MVTQNEKMLENVIAFLPGPSAARDDGPDRRDVVYVGREEGGDRQGQEQGHESATR